MARWQDWRWRLVLIAWLGLEGIGTILRMGAHLLRVMLLRGGGARTTGWSNRCHCCVPPSC